MIDFILASRQNKSRFTDTRAFHSARSWTDHSLVIGTYAMVKPPKKLRFSRKQQLISSRTPRFNVARLRQEPVAKRWEKVLQRKMRERPYPQPPDHQQQPVNPIARWMHVKKAICETAEEVIGLQPKGKGNDWFDDYDTDINEAIHGKREAFCRYMNTPTPENKLRYQKARNRAQRIIRDRKNRWWLNKAQEIQALYDLGRSREYYMCIKKLISSTLPGIRLPLTLSTQRPESSLKTNRTS